MANENVKTHININRLMTDIIRKIFLLLLISTYTLSSLGCAGVLNIFEKKKEFVQTLPDKWQISANEVFVDNKNIVSDLNSLINDKEVQKLIQEALKNNPDLKATAYRLASTKYLLETEFARRLPDITVGGRGEKSGEGDEDFSKFSANANIKWEIDVWQRLADEYDAKNYELEAKYHDYIAARNSLATKVLKSWIEIVLAKKSILIEQKRIGTLENIENIIIERYERGLGEVKDIDTTRANTERARASLAGRELDLVKAKKQLEILLGRYPTGTIDSSKDFPSISTPIVGIPSSLLQQRADIQSAWSTLQQSHSLVIAANKAYLPSFTLTGEASNIVNDVGDILTGKILWNIGIDIMQPVFDGKKIFNTARSKAEEAKASWESYRNTVLNAMFEVEDSLATDKLVARKIKHINKSLVYAKESRAFYEEQYSKGLTNITDVLYARGIEYDTEISQLQIHTLQIENRIQLAISVGLNVITVQ